MKRIFIITAAFATVTLSFSIKKEKKIIPPGTALITDNFFADETEVSNFSWQEYESWNKIKYGAGSKEHLASLPDTLVWKKTSSHNEPYVRYYYRHPAYKNYPVVGISYDQAIAFCKWRTERVKEFYYKKNKKEINIEYLLPSKEQWQLISNNGKEIFTNGSKNKKGEVLFNYIGFVKVTNTSADMMKDNADLTAPVYSYRKNCYGLFNTFGNVAEMISEKGVSKGGSWQNTIEECRADEEISYTVPTAWLGFRCVCIINK